MRLEKAQSSDDTLELVMSPREWSETHALAKFAQAGIAYDAQSPYVGQIFVYVMLQPWQIPADNDTQAAFAAIDQLAKNVPASASEGDITLRLGKAQMRQLLTMLEMAADSQDQADIVHDGHPEKSPCFPEIEISPSHYVETFRQMLNALYEGRTRRIDRPEV